MIETLSAPDVMKLLVKQSKRNKYGVSPEEDRTHNGIVYASKGEMNLAQRLEILLKAGQLRSLKRQFPLPMKVNGVLVCTHYVDFRCENMDGSIYYAEFKGKRTENYNLKMRLLFAIDPGIKKMYRVIKS